MNDSTKINDILKNLLFSDIGQFLFNYKQYDPKRCRLFTSLS